MKITLTKSLLQTKLTLKSNIQIEFELKIWINFIVTLQIAHSRGKKFIDSRGLHYYYILIVRQSPKFTWTENQAFRTLFITRLLNKMLDGSKRTHLKYWFNFNFGKTYYTNFQQASQILSPYWPSCTLGLNSVRFDTNRSNIRFPWREKNRNLLVQNKSIIIIIFVYIIN